MVEVVLHSVRVDVGSAAPILLLEEVNGPRVLTIFVGGPEATSIAFALQDLKPPRPLTHDLLGQVVEALGARVFSVEVTELVDNTFYANLRLLTDGGEAVVSCRPSDAIALALRVGAPILVSDELMAAEGREMEISDEDDEIDTAGGSDESELVDQMREFLNNVKPEDFDT